jgi:purine-binding chemotaxis protein CheW
MSDLVVRRGAALRSRNEGSLDYLSFTSAGESYAVELRSVQEIVVPPPITFVPRAKKVILGVCSVRGQLVTVLDLRACLGFPALEVSRKRRILLGRTADDELMGLLVDEVRQVVRMLPKEIELSTSGGGGEFSEVVRGMGRPNRGELLVLLDLALLLGKGRA